MTALFLLACALGRADDANYTVVGGAGNFTRNRFIRMAKEDVRIDMSDNGIHVVATFWFANEGPKTVATMAFPDETTYEGPATHDGSTAVIRRFSSTVDGKAVRVRRRPTHIPADPDTDISVKSVWLKLVPFEQGQRRRVKVDYVATNGIEVGGHAMNTYVLKTGATWKGPIGECRLTVDWSRVRQYSRPSLAFKRKHSQVLRRWVSLGPTRATILLKDLEPKFDLDLSMIKGFWNFTLNGEPLPLALSESSQFEGEHPRGKPDDIEFPVAGLGGFFGRLTDGVDEWENPIANSFGNLIELQDANHVKLGGHKVVPISRPATGPLRAGPDHKELPTYIHLKDLVQALGGDYRYVPSSRRVDIRLPTKRRGAHGA